MTGTLVITGASRGGSPGERVRCAASKGAIVSMSHGLAKEVIRSGIRVNCVSPGLTETEMNPADRLAKLIPGVPAGRVGLPEEIAKVILFLPSEESSCMVGVDVTVSGGR